MDNKTDKRGYIPSTFDSMMAEFGNRVKRGELKEELDEKLENIVIAKERPSTPEI